MKNLIEMQTHKEQIEGKEKEAIFDAFKGYDKIYMVEDDVPFQKIAVCIFDGWLRDDTDLLDCKSQEERNERDKKHNSFLSKLFDNTRVISLRYTDDKYIIERFNDKESFLYYCRDFDEKSSSEFYFLLLPEFKAIYLEDWDDTNVLFFKDRNDIQIILTWIKDAGLYTIEFEER